MPLIYKTLFEVKLMHEFYLTGSDGRTVFSFNSQEERIDFLSTQLTSDRGSINRDLEFRFPEEFEATYKHHNLKLLSTYSGFKVVIRINQKIQEDGSLLFEPFAALPDNLSIYILFSKKDNSIGNFTNTRIDSPIPALYFFSNDELSGTGDFPYLTNIISSLRIGYQYEQGELASFGPGDIRSYYQNSSGNQWNTIPGTNFANENDRLLLPLKFYYSLAGKNVTKASFTLKNRSGDTIKVIEARSSDKMTKTLLDFSDVAGMLEAPLIGGFPDFVFTLEVNGNNSYSNMHHVFFGQRFYSNELWGMAAIKPKAGNSSFDLITREGHLKTRKNSAGKLVDVPLFEIPIRSRYAYLRYSNNKHKELQLVAELQDYLDKEGNVLLSQKRAILLLISLHGKVI